jgi:putative ABC transport system permease protein
VTVPANLLVAWKALQQNRLQTALTLVGMSVGVAMVVIVAGLGGGAQARIEAQLESAGPTMITVRAGNFTPAAIVDSGEQDSSGGEPSEGAQGVFDDNDPNLRLRGTGGPRRQRSPAAPLADAEYRTIVDVDDVRAVAAAVAGNVRVDDARGTAARIVRLEGIAEAWPEMASWTLVDGRWPTAAEQTTGADVAVVTRAASARLLGDRATLGGRLTLDGRSIEIVGVLDEPTPEGPLVVPPVYVPLRLAQHILRRQTYDVITVRTASVATTTRVAREVRARLRAVRQVPDDTLDDFRVETQSVAAMPLGGGDPRMARAVHANAVGFEQASYEEMARSMRQAGRTLALLLGGAAAVSLLVGGIGVMNIMLVSVASRTREIGLRMAMGARGRDVLAQFLAEAVSLASVGGLIGLALGSAGLSVAEHGLHWATAVSPTMFAMALTLAALTGVAFGLGPARRAAALDPVVALRAE